MELEKFARQLKLMLLLTQNRLLSIEEICNRVSMSRRSVYRYIDAFKSMGFVVKKEGTRYRLDHSSPFFSEIVTGIQFTEAEGVALSQILNSVYNNSAEVRALREKLSNLYNPDILSRHGVDSTLAQNISRIFQAIKEERVVLLRDYNSPSSGQVSNRIVEPYLFINENAEVRCYELSTKMNKTFKVSRCADVELLDLLWSHKEEHMPFYSDLFGFTGDTRLPVSILLGQLSTSVLLEEYPDAQRQMSLQPDGRQLLKTEVCSYVGIARFVLGLYDDIEVVDSPEFKEYLLQRVHHILEKE
ncbi:MAG: WYL domain-containing protein [Bacteroidales bacterium]|nr:WYL domain-containing protein [Bacteroidales bacterium]